ncbi:MAG: hypothetical protein V3T72_03465 [Thermoanaerobaculia bacterium]
MAAHRTSIVLSLTLLLAALFCGPGLALAQIDDAPASGGSGFGAPERAQLSAARELPERLDATPAIGTSKPAAALWPEATSTTVNTAVRTASSAPLFLVHCAFLC